MKRDEILTAVRQLAQSQGSYGRLLQSLDGNDEALDYLESLNFNDTLDMVLYLEG